MKPCEARPLFSASYEMSPYGVYVVSKEKKIIYKNRLARKLAPNVRVGALLKTYSCLDTDGDSLTETVFSGKEYTVFVHNTTVENEKISIIFLSVGKLIVHELTAEVIDFYNSKVAEINYQNRSAINSMKTCGDHAKKRYLELLANNVDRLQCFDHFARLFINNACKNLPDEKKTYNVSQICATIHDRIVSRVKELDLAFEIDVRTNTLLCTLHVRHLIYILLCAINFCIKNCTGNTITLEILENPENGVVRFTFHDRYKIVELYQKNMKKQAAFSFSEICDNNIFLPLYSIARLCEENNISLSFCKNSHRNIDKFVFTLCFPKSDALPEPVFLEKDGMFLSEIDLFSRAALADLFSPNLENPE